MFDAIGNRAERDVGATFDCGDDALAQAGPSSPTFGRLCDVSVCRSSRQTFEDAVIDIVEWIG